MEKQIKRKELLVPALPNGFRNDRKPPGVFKRMFIDSYLSGPQLYDLSAHMSSEHSENIPSFLWSVFSKLRKPTEISLLLTSPSRLEVLEHYVTVVRDEKKYAETKGPRRNAFLTSYDAFDVPLFDGTTFAHAVHTNNGGHGFFFDSGGIFTRIRNWFRPKSVKKGIFRHFSLKTHDFSVGKGKFVNTTPSEPRQTVVIPLRSSDSDRVVGCLVVKGEDLRLKNKSFIMGAMTFIAGSSRLLFSLIKGQLDSLTKLMVRTAFDSSLLLHSERYMNTLTDEAIDAEQVKHPEETIDSIRVRLSILKTGRNFSVVMSDIDHFKQYNDTFGHQNGDKVLVDVAGVTRSTTRSREGEHDLVARFGGEEFIILYDVDVGRALSAASRLRRNVHDQTGVTCSYGVVDAETTEYLFSTDRVKLKDVADKFPGFTDMPEAQQFALKMVYLADKAMYHAKDEGRNRVAYARQVGEGESLYVTHESSPLEPTQETAKQTGEIKPKA